MKITYIHHSSFLAETESACLLFDYFQGGLPEIPAGKTLYVFASHRHPDHFSKKIFDLAADHENIQFLLSFDIWRKRVPKAGEGRTVFLKPGEVYEDGKLKAEAFQSTDEGVAFWCSVDGWEIYHAGDLNHWYWDGEEEEWNRNMTAAYRREIGKMRGRTADVAFLPLDPRLGEHFFLGIDDFMKEVDATKIFPMHFWGEFDVSSRLKSLPCSAAYRDRIVEIERDGQEFEMKKSEETDMKFQFAHNNFNVMDLDKSLKFYEEALGLKEVKRKEAADGSFIIVYLGDGETPHKLELTWLRDWEKDHYDLGDNEFHLAFTTDDFEAAHKKHKEMGCICFENEKMGIYFITDPDEYWLEIVPIRK